jgi:hypothetical protein
MAESVSIRKDDSVSSSSDDAELWEYNILNDHKRYESEKHVITALYGTLDSVGHFLCTNR